VFNVLYISADINKKNSLDETLSQYKFCNYSSVDDLRDAMESLIEETFSLVIMDEVILNDDNLELFEMLREDDEFKNFPFILILEPDTSHEIVEKMYNSGVTFCLRNPLIPKALTNLLDIFIASYEKQEVLSLKIDETETKSVTDPLTKAFNRYKFNADLENNLAKTASSYENLSLIMFDIDHFKRVNDTYGHDVGDEVIVEVVQKVSSLYGGSNPIYRVGGEEFIMMTTSAKEDLVAESQAILNVISSGPMSSKELKITVSIGVTEHSFEEDIESFIKRVDEALYKAKSNGRNRVELL
jgi:two-component system, cell cycle response regulator